MKNLKDIQQIEQYLEGDLSDQDMEDMEVRFLIDDQFREDFETMRTLVKGIKLSARKTTLRDKLLRLEKISSDRAGDKKDPKTIQKHIAKVTGLRPRSSWVFTGLAVAASLLLLISLLTGAFDQPTPPDQLFQQHFVVAANQGLQNSRNDQVDNPTILAYRAYDLKNYAQAADLFESIVDQSEYRLTDLFHLGNCYLILEKWDKAIQALKEVAEAEVLLSENAKWYLALVYLRTGNTEEAKLLLQDVAAPSDRAKQAGKIVKALD